MQFLDLCQIYGASRKGTWVFEPQVRAKPEDGYRFVAHISGLPLTKGIILGSCLISPKSLLVCTAGIIKPVVKWSRETTYDTCSTVTLQCVGSWISILLF